MFARFYYAFFLFLLIWNIFECHYGYACNQSIINAIRRSVNTRKNRSLYFLQIIWIGVLFFRAFTLFLAKYRHIYENEDFFLLLSLFICIVWNAFFNVCLLVNSLIVFVVWNFSHFFEASSLSRSPVLFFDVLLDLRVRTRKNNFQTVKLWIQIRNEYAYMSLCMYEQHFEGSSKFLTAPDS